MSALIADIESLTIPAEDVRPGDTIREDDGRVRTVSTVVLAGSWAPHVKLTYTAGPSDVFRRSYPLTLIDPAD